MRKALLHRETAAWAELAITAGSLQSRVCPNQISSNVLTDHSRATIERVEPSITNTESTMLRLQRLKKVNRSGHWQSPTHDPAAMPTRRAATVQTRSKVTSGAAPFDAHKLNRYSSFKLTYLTTSVAAGYIRVGARSTMRIGSPYFRLRRAPHRWPQRNSVGMAHADEV